MATNDLYTEATGKAREQEGVISMLQINLPQIKAAIAGAVGKQDVDLPKLAEGSCEAWRAGQGGRSDQKRATLPAPESWSTVSLPAC